MGDSLARRRDALIASPTFTLKDVMTKSALIGFKLQGRRALVTGSASGIGLATAGLLARSGAHVAMNDLPTEALITAVSHFKAQGFRVDAVPGDLSMSSSARDVALKQYVA